MGKKIEQKADMAYPRANDDAPVSAYAERGAYIKGYEEALIDMRNHLNIAAVAGKNSWCWICISGLIEGLKIDIWKPMKR